MPSILLNDDLVLLAEPNHLALLLHMLVDDVGKEVLLIHPPHLRRLEAGHTKAFEALVEVFHEVREEGVHNFLDEDGASLSHNEGLAVLVEQERHVSMQLGAAHKPLHRAEGEGELIYQRTHEWRILIPPRHNAGVSLPLLVEQLAVLCGVQYGLKVRPRALDQDHDARGGVDGHPHRKGRTLIGYAVLHRGDLQPQSLERLLQLLGIQLFDLNLIAESGHESLGDELNEEALVSDVLHAEGGEHEVDPLPKDDGEVKHKDDLLQSANQ